MNHQRIAVIGCGVWGRNIVRNFYNLNVLDTVCDIDEENLKKVTEQYKNVKVTKEGFDEAAVNLVDGKLSQSDKNHVQQTIVNDGPKIGRNDPCPCGSGKKYKNCCGRNQ